MLNLWRNKRRLLPLMALLLGTQACFNQNDFDPERIAGLKANPSVAIPLLHGSLSLEDLLSQNESQYVDIDEDKLIHLLYSDTLYSTSIRDHFLLPDLSAEKFYLTGAKTLSQGNSETLAEDRVYLDFDFEESDLDKIQLKAGNLNLSASSSADTDVELLLTFPTIRKAGQPLEVRLNLPGAYASGPESTQLNLQGYDIDLQEFPLGDNLVPVDILATATPSQQNILLGTSDYVQFALSINGMDFNLITGNFGQLEVSLPQKELEVSFFETIFSKARFSLKNPLLRLDFLNSNGVPVQVVKEILQARKQSGEVLAVTTEPNDLFDLSAPSLPGETTTTSIAITNVGAIIDHVPAFMDYKLSGRLNVGQPESIVNFVTDSSRSGVVLHADIPLWGSLEGLTLSDTLEMSLQPEDAEIQEDSNGGVTVTDANAAIRTVISNQFPLGSEVQVYFANAHYGISDSLFSNGPFRIKASKVNVTGDLLAEEVSIEDLSISDKQLERILEANFIIIKAHLYTTRNADGSQPHVKIKSNYKLDVNLGLKTSMNISVKK